MAWLKKFLTGENSRVWLEVNMLMQKNFEKFKMVRQLRFLFLHRNELSTCCAYESIQAPKLPEHDEDSSEEGSEFPTIGTGSVSQKRLCCIT
jgi:hypothetical protein